MRLVKNQISLCNCSLIRFFMFHGKIFLDLNFFFPRFFEEKQGDRVFGFLWCVVSGAWL